MASAPPIASSASRVGYVASNRSTQRHQFSPTPAQGRRPSSGDTRSWRGAHRFRTHAASPPPAAWLGDRGVRAAHKAYVGALDARTARHDDGPTRAGTTTTAHRRYITSDRVDQSRTELRRRCTRLDRCCGSFGIGARNGWSQRLWCGHRLWRRRGLHGPMRGVRGAGRQCSAGSRGHQSQLGRKPLVCSDHAGG